MKAKYYCPKENCSWEGEELPPGQACPRCLMAVEQYAPDGNPSDRPASQNVVLDQAAWKAATDAAGKVLAKTYKSCLYERYAAFGEQLAQLLAEKQFAYGDSFGKSCRVLEALYPNGITVEQYRDLLTVTRIIDKLFRVANQKDYGGESPYQDIAGYAVLAACADEEDVAETSASKGQPVEL